MTTANSVNELARKTGISQAQMHRLVKQKDWPFGRRGPCDVEEVLSWHEKRRAKKGSGEYVQDGVVVWTKGRIGKELGLGEAALNRLEATGRLVFLPGPPPRTKVCPAETVRKLRDELEAEKAEDRCFIAETAWIIKPRALRLLEIAGHTLHVYSHPAKKRKKRGLHHNPCLPGERLIRTKFYRGRTWYHEGDVLETRASLMMIRGGVRTGGTPEDPTLIKAAIQRVYGFKQCTIDRWKIYCPWVTPAEGETPRLEPVYENGRITSSTGESFRVHQLNEIQQNRASGTRAFTGIFADGRVTLSKAAELSGESFDLLYALVDDCPYLAEGRLPSRKQKIPGGHVAHSVLIQDVREAIRRRDEATLQAEGLATGKEILDELGVTAVGDRVTLSGVLRTAAEEELLKNSVIPDVPVPTGDGIRSHIDALHDSKEAIAFLKTYRGDLFTDEPKAGEDRPVGDAPPRQDQEYEPLADSREYDVMQVLWEQKAFGPASKITTEEIARLVTGSPNDLNNFKEPVSRLVQEGVLAVKKGRGGGVWLTQRGKKMCARLFNSSL